MTKDVFLPHNQKLAEATNFLIGERDENRPRNVGSEEITPLLWHFLMTTVRMKRETVSHESCFTTSDAGDNFVFLCDINHC